jgi:Peptidase M15
VIGNRNLSDNFKLHDFLRSNTAERNGEWMEQQFNPPDSVVESLEYLVETAIQPVRNALSYPVSVSSGYRSPPVNDAVGSTSTSQHLIGEAGDLGVSRNFLSDPDTALIRWRIEEDIRKSTGFEVRHGVNANFYLFAVICLRLERFDIDQLIHEFGPDFGQPAWVHVAASKRQSKREILLISSFSSPKVQRPTVEQALAYGTKEP